MANAAVSDGHAVPETERGVSVAEQPRQLRRSQTTRSEREREGDGALRTVGQQQQQQQQSLVIASPFLRSQTPKQDPDGMSKMT